MSSAPQTPISDTSMSIASLSSTHTGSHAHTKHIQANAGSHIDGESDGQRHVLQQPQDPISDTSFPTHNSSYPPPFPKRVSKACCSCRRDKIKCNGERPCGGCIKKGLPPEKCIDGCLPCRRSRERCEGGMPCLRCAELQIICEEETSLSTSLLGMPLSRPESINFPMKASTAHPNAIRSKPSERAKLACLACRRDNKKCDDQRPCARCKTRSEECIHVARRPKVVKLRCQACREENRKCEDQRPCKFCTDTGVQCSDIPRKGRGHGTRVKAACIHCRRDKIQCGAERPCRGCKRRGLECIDRICTCSAAARSAGQECTHCRARRTASAYAEALVHNELHSQQESVLGSERRAEQGKEVVILDPDLESTRSRTLEDAGPPQQQLVVNTVVEGPRYSVASSSTQTRHARPSADLARLPQMTSVMEANQSHTPPHTPHALQSMHDAAIASLRNIAAMNSNVNVGTGIGVGVRDVSALNTMPGVVSAPSAPPPTRVPINVDGGFAMSEFHLGQRAHTHDHAVVGSGRPPQISELAYASMPPRSARP